MPRIRTVALGGSTISDPIMISTVDVYEVRSVLEERLDVFQRVVHVTLPGDRGLRYAISERAYQELARHRGPAEVARMVFEQLLAAMKKEAT